MQSDFYFDGNEREISWVIEANSGKVEQKRIHAEYFFEKVSIEQSKYIALHVGIFWGIGKFLIKNEDTVQIMVDTNAMLSQLSNRVTPTDSLIKSRIAFLNQLINQRNITVRFVLIEPAINKASLRS